MTGYDKSPEYGGRPVTWVAWAGLVAVIAAIAGWAIWSG